MFVKLLLFLNWIKSYPVLLIKTARGKSAVRGEKNRGKAMLTTEKLQQELGTLLDSVVKVNRNYVVENDPDVLAAKAALKKAIIKAYFGDADCVEDNKKVTRMVFNLWLTDATDGDSEKSAALESNVTRYVFDENGNAKKGLIRDGVPTGFEPFIIDSAASAATWGNWCTDVRKALSAKVRKARETTAAKAQRYIIAARAFRSLSKTIHLVCVRMKFDEQELRAYYANEIAKQRAVNAAALQAKAKKA